MIFLIICLSALVIAGGVIYYYVSAASETIEAVPFGVGVLMAMGLNIVKVIWLKKAINATVDMDTPKTARYFYQFQYFLRLLLTAAILLIAALAPNNIVSLIGVVAGIFTFPITMRLMHFFIPQDVEIPRESGKVDPVQEAIAQIEQIEKEAE